MHDKIKSKKGQFDFEMSGAEIALTEVIQAA